MISSDDYTLAARLYNMFSTVIYTQNSLSEKMNFYRLPYYKQREIASHMAEARKLLEKKETYESKMSRAMIADYRRRVATENELKGENNA